MTAGALASLTRYISPATPLQEAAAYIVARHAAELPDLSRLIVLLPSLHAAAPFARALVRAAGCPTLLLPELTTLPQLAARMRLTVNQTPDLLREELLYAALRERDWFPERERWGLTRALIGLFDELTLHRVGLPDGEAGFAARLAQAYGAPAGSSLRFEASLVHTLWRAHNDILASQPDRTTAYVMRLVQLAERADRPLYGVGLVELSPAEGECLSRYAKRQPVHLLLPSVLGTSNDPLQEVLAAAWEKTDPPLRERARDLARRLSRSPLSGRLALYGASTLEEVADAAAMQIRRWLAEGKRTVAVVAQNRLAARRLRALLERAQILVEDETGWTLSTTSAATVVMRWLDLLATDFHHRELLDFLKSPLVFADMEAAARREAVYQLERLIRAQDLVSRLRHYLAAARGNDSPALPLLERLDAARQKWRAGPQTLSRWFELLGTTLDELGITPALQRDPAGMQLLQTFAILKQESAACTQRFTLAEWRQLLAARLEQATFRDPTIESPVVFTHLAATRLRAFEGVILLGCAEDELPSPGNSGIFFNEAVRRELGLPTRQAAAAIERADLAALLAASGSMLALWQNRRQGEEVLMSPWLDGLSTLHELAWGESLKARHLLLPAPHPSLPAAGTPRPALRLAPEEVPTRISASGYRSLLACPYQYYARHVLHLNEEDEVQVEMEKRDFGEVVHDILARFHARHPIVSALSAEAAEEALRKISEETFAPLLARNYLNHAWKLRWEKLIPDYLRWQREREKQGWRVAGRETPRAVELLLADGAKLVLKGTLDRVDVKEAALAVLDYKTGDARQLRKNLEPPGEDVQLSVYALLAGQGVTAAGYVALTREGTEWVPFPRDLSQEAQAVAARLVRLFEALRAGAVLPAHGNDEACARCEMHGLCRRRYWNDA